MKSQVEGQLSLFNKEELFVMPEEFRGNVEKENEWITHLRLERCSRQMIAKYTGLSDSQVYNRVKEMRKQDNSYNDDHVNEKYYINGEFIKSIKPNSVLDLFCGKMNFYRGKVKNVTSNDIDSEIEADYNMDALKCLCYLYTQDKKYDIIDLDGYGNSCDCFDLAIKMAKKGLVITFGEANNCRRFKHENLIRAKYNLSLEDYNIDTVIQRIYEIGLANKKYITPKYRRTWRGIWRVWFEIETFSARAYKEKKEKEAKAHT